MQFVSMGSSFPPSDSANPEMKADGANMHIGERWRAQTLVDRIRYDCLAIPGSLR